MKANEFQIGDFVLVNGKPHKIEMITKKKIGYHLKGNECHMHYARICDVEPIPITPEILKSTGFYIFKSDDMTLCKSVDFSIEIRFTDKDIWTYIGVPNCTINLIEIRYVHELQHALRLCKFDKEITL